MSASRRTDILVVLRDADAVTRRTLIDMRLPIGTVPVDYDLLITSSADFAWRRNYVGKIEHRAAHEGIELYARAMWSEAVALATAAVERYLKAVLGTRSRPCAAWTAGGSILTAMGLLPPHISLVADLTVRPGGP